MSISILQQIKGDVVFSSAFHSPFSLAMGAGKTIVLVLSYFPISIPPTSVTDSAGNNYVQKFGPIPGASANAADISVWLASNTNAFGTGNNILAHYDAPGPDVNTGWAYELDTTQGTIIFDRSASNAITSSSSTAPTGTTAVTRYPNEFVVAFVDPSGGPAVAPGGPWIDDQGLESGSGCVHQLVSVMSAYGTTFTAVSPCEWNGGVATFGDGQGVVDVISMLGNYKLR